MTYLKMIYSGKLGGLLVITLCLAAAAVHLGAAQTACPGEPEASCPEATTENTSAEACPGAPEATCPDVTDDAAPANAPAPAGASQSDAGPPKAPPSTVPTDYLNQELPKWVRFKGEERMRMEGFEGGGFKTGNDDTYVLNRIRFNMNLIPTHWLRFEFQVQDARVWFKTLKPYAPPYQDTWDLRLAYVDIGASEGPAELRVGRQELAFGDERLVGNTPWTNASRSFDAARATLRHGKYRLDIFASSVVVLHDGSVGYNVPGNNLHGLYGGMENVVPKSTIEPYVLWRLNPRQKSETGKIGNLDSYTLGVRWVGKLPAGFDYNTETDKQVGSLGADVINAWAGHWLVGRRFESVPWKPRPIVEFNHASGDGNPHNGHRNTFDQLYPTAHDKYGLADQVGWKNINHARTGVELSPNSKWGINAKYSSYWLANAHDALYNTSSSVVASVPNGSGGRFVGQELDESGIYKYSKQLQFGAGFSHIFPGRFLLKATPGGSYNSPYLFLMTAF